MDNIRGQHANSPVSDDIDFMPPLAVQAQRFIAAANRIKELRDELYENVADLLFYDGPVVGVNRNWRVQTTWIPLTRDLEYLIVALDEGIRIAEQHRPGPVTPRLDEPE